MINRFIKRPEIDQVQPYACVNLDKKIMIDNQFLFPVQFSRFVQCKFNA
jgi:hypothetical protein